MEKEITYLIVFTCQIGNASFRGWNINSIRDKHINNARISWFLFGCTHLISISIGVKSFIEADWKGVFFWFLGSMIGQEISMRKWIKK